MGQIDDVHRLLGQAERLKHAQDKYRNYEWFKDQLDTLCGYDSGAKYNKTLYEDSMQKLAEILRI